MSAPRKYLVGQGVHGVMERSDRLVAQSGVFRSDLYSDEGINDFLEGAHFEQLSYAEKTLAYKALSITAESNPWLLGMQDDDGEDMLFPFEAPTTTIAAHDDDSIVLSGALGAEAIEEYKELYSGSQDREEVKDDVFSLERLIAIGAFIRSRESFISIGAKTTYKQGLYEKSVGIGGDLHGDFVMIHTSGVPGAAIAPNGMRVPFAPLETVTLAGYHSIEIGIVEACLQHVIPGMGTLERKAYFEQIMNADIDKDRNGLRAFGDYGSSLRHGLNLLGMDEEAVVRQGNTLDTFLVQPGNFKLRLEVRSMPNGLRFIQTEEREDGTLRESKPIDVSDALIPDLINTIRFADMGRVSPQEIEETARTILLGADLSTH